MLIEGLEAEGVLKKPGEDTGSSDAAGVKTVATNMDLASASADEIATFGTIKPTVIDQSKL